MKDVIILGAGVGSRLRPMTDAVPKLLVPVVGRSILERALSVIVNQASSVQVVVGYRWRDISAFVIEHFPTVRLVHNHAYQSTNNMHSLYLALAAVNFDSGVLIMNGDCVYEPRVLEAALRVEDDRIFVDSRYPVNAESMKVKVSSEGHIEDISKGINAEDGGVVSIDLYSLTSASARELYEQIETYEMAADRNKWTEIALRDLLLARSGGTAAIMPYDIAGAMWMEIDNSDDLALANERFS